MTAKVKGKVFLQLIDVAEFVLFASRFKCLKWDKRERRYIPLEVDLFKKGEIDESYEFI